MTIHFWRKRLPLALAATRSVTAIMNIPPELFQVREAVSTLGVMDALAANPQLVIADVETLEECPQMSRPALRTALDSLGQDGAVVVSSAQFTAAPDRWLGEALLARGLRDGVRFLPPRVVMVTNYCGGVGKTTLSLAMAKRFRQASGLATALVEAGVGGSSLGARLPGERASLYGVVTQQAIPGAWEGVDLYPSDNWDANVLAADERTKRVLAGIACSHTLTICDTFPTNPLWKDVLALASDILVVGAPRQDSLAQTETILRRLKEEIAALDPQPRLHLVLNQVRTPGEWLSLGGKPSTWVSFDERKAERLDGALAEPLLNLVYPGWAKRGGRRGARGEKRRTKGVVRGGWGVKREARNLEREEVAA